MVSVTSFEYYLDTGPLTLALVKIQEDFKLSQAIYAPELNANLLTVDRLKNEDGYGVTLLPAGSEIFDLQTRIKCC